MLRDTIYTIPINDVFSPKQGCPVCRMRDMLESRAVEYIMGAAMMEPDIRLETNKYGFCKTHLDMMSMQKNRLSMALMLETHLDELMKNHMPYKSKKGETAPSDSCYICNEIDSAMKKMLSTAQKLYFSDSSFKDMIQNQEYFCLPHYEMLCAGAANNLSKKEAAVFVAAITEITEKYMKGLRDNVHGFTLMYDYRNAGKTEKDESVINSLENAINFLTGRKAEKKE